MVRPEEIEFYNRLAVRWDGLEDLETLGLKLLRGIRSFGIRPDESVLDIGCGTGNLTVALLQQLESPGRVLAIDISPEMLRIAQRKVQDSRVTWILSDVSDMPLPDQSADRIICYSVWPHLGEAEFILPQFIRMLKPDGWLHIWHTNSREVINRIHQQADESVRDHLLKPAADLTRELKAHGFTITQMIDDESEYLISAHLGNH